MINAKKMTENEHKLVNYVLYHTEKWRNDRVTNYEKRWDEYERIWLGVWHTEDRLRESERSRAIVPATQQAIESWQSDIEEATFGKGGFFDIDDEASDAEKADVEQTRRELKQDCKKNKVEAAISEAILNAGVFGTAIAELIVKKVKRQVPATQNLLPGMDAVGVQSFDEFCVKVHAVHPRNFLIDPAACTIDEGLGCAIEEFMPAFQIVQDMEEGIYTHRDLGFAPPDEEIEPTKTDVGSDEKDVVRVMRYYGLVPKALLSKDTEKYVELFPTDSIGATEMYEDLVEAVVVIANESEILKAEESPYMMKDRPVVAAPADIRPGKFHGRGIAEKAYNMQKVMDGQIRTHLDSSALTAIPMMGVDGTRMPKGFKFDVRPGRSVITNGPPAEVLQPLKFGESSSLNVDTANLFERYLLQATGTLDVASIPAQAGNGADAEAMGVTVGAIIKRHRRTMTQFQAKFVMPLIEKMAWRYMQFDPQRYPSKDFQFLPTGTMGIIAREYEQRQYMGMMSTLGPESPLVPMLMRGILKNSSLENREELIKELEQGPKPDPQAQKLAQKQEMLLDLQIEEQKMKNLKLQAEANYTNVKADLEPRKIEIGMISALTKNSEEADEFGQRVKIAELALKEADLEEKGRDRESNERIAAIQQVSAQATKQREMEEKEKDRELKREEIKARRAEKQITRDKAGNIAGVKTKD
jgi:hypothetical protein